jgi:hypothetical protein
MPAARGLDGARKTKCIDRDHSDPFWTLRHRARRCRDPLYRAKRAIAAAFLMRRADVEGGLPGIPVDSSAGFGSVKIKCRASVALTPDGKETVRSIGPTFLYSRRQRPGWGGGNLQTDRKRR